MKNTLTDVHDILVTQLEAVTDEDIQGEELKVTLARAAAATKVAGAIIGNAAVALKAAKLAQDSPEFQAPPMLRSDAPRGLPARSNGAGG